MFNNLLALHVVEESNQESISVKNIYEITKSLSFPVYEQERKVRALPETQAPAITDFKWPPQEEEIVITHNLASVQGYSSMSNEIQGQLLTTLQSWAKDDFGKTYWVYSEENTNSYKKKNILDMRPLVSLAKNIKRKEPVFALLNREVIFWYCCSAVPNQGQSWCTTWIIIDSISYAVYICYILLCSMFNKNDISGIHVKNTSYLRIWISIWSTQS